MVLSSCIHHSFNILHIFNVEKWLAMHSGSGRNGSICWTCSWSMHDIYPSQVGLKKSQSTWWCHYMQILSALQSQWSPLTNGSLHRLWCCFSCQPKQNVAQTVKLSVICNALTLILHHYEVLVSSQYLQCRWLSGKPRYPQTQLCWWYHSLPLSQWWTLISRFLFSLRVHLNWL